MRYCRWLLLRVRVSLVGKNSSSSCTYTKAYIKVYFIEYVREQNMRVEFFKIISRWFFHLRIVSKKTLQSCIWLVGAT